MNDNFSALDAAGLLTREGLIQLVRNAFTGSFRGDAEKNRPLKHIDNIIEQPEFQPVELHRRTRRHGVDNA